GPRLVDKLQLISPAEPRPASHNIKHGFQLPMMMRPGLGVGMYHDRSRPELLRADTSMRDSLGASHPWSLWSISIQFAAPNNAQPVILPVNLVVPVPRTPCTARITHQRTLSILCLPSRRALRR